MYSSRTARQSSRKDFLTRIIAQRDAEIDSDPSSKCQDLVSDLQIAAHVSDFILAGSETTSTVLPTAVYYILKSQTVYQRLVLEIRAAFGSCGDISDSSCRNLTYLDAVCREAMRIYSPVPIATPRLVPGGGGTIDGNFVPAGVRLLSLLALIL